MPDTQFHVIGRHNWNTAVSYSGQAEYLRYKGFQYQWFLDYISKILFD